MIKIICLGKIKEKYLKDAITDFQKRITKYSKIEIIELGDEALENENIILAKEKDKILPHLNSREYLICLNKDGEMLNSVELASKIEKTFIHNPTITFIIGSSYGIHPDILAKANFNLSFSNLTFPHQLFRLILLEQIYRGFKIINHETYHK